MRAEALRSVRFGRLAALGVVFWAASAARGQLVISQIFGASGGNAGAANGDFIEIFNRSCIAVDISQYTVQVAGTATSTTWQVVTLPHRALDPGQYFCIRLTTATTGVAFTADLNATAVGDVLQPSSGKAAIVLLSNGALPGVSCPPASSVVDLVVYASTSGVCTEGPRFNPSSALAAGRGYQRKLGGCQDTNNNLNDFVSDTNPANPRTTTSPTNPCTPPATYGGCTLADSSCQAVADTAACTALGGTYLGDCIQCEFGQACCIPGTTVTCQLLTSAGCTAAGGLLSAGQLVCPPTPACPGVGRCCATDGSCTVTFQAFCTAPSTFSGVGTNCSGSPCLGRCCEPISGSCSLTIQADCQAPNTYGGVGSTCTGTPCQGACCAPNGDCAMTGPSGCDAPNSFGGIGTTCSTAACQGACCIAEDGTCVLSGPATCTAPNVFGGLGSTCATVQCSGRCCHAGGSCTVTAVGQCTGTFSIGQTCDPIDIVTFNNANLVIQDNPVNIPNTQVQSVTGVPGPITDLDVDLNAVHTWPGDCKVTLEHLGVLVTLYDRPGVPASTFGCATDDFNIILDDEGSGGPIETVCSATPPSALSPPNYTPESAPGTSYSPGGLSAFDGLDPNGDWTIVITDAFTGDTGTLLSWSLHIAHPGQACPATGCTCFGDMNGDNAVNGRDIKTFASCLASGGTGCPCGDINHSGTVTTADIGPFIAAVIAGACAP